MSLEQSSAALEVELGLEEQDLNGSGGGVTQEGETRSEARGRKENNVSVWTENDSRNGDYKPS